MNKSLEELDAIFGDGTAQEEHEIMREAAMNARRKSLASQKSVDA